MVREVISMSLPDSYWVEAELSEAREGYGGHCYLELIEKDERSNTPIAKAHASCWRNRWMFIKPNFERITGQRIHAGMKVLLKVHAQFHENYGFSWIVDDIDPNYTMGDMARKRLEIINTLKAEGVFELQKELVLPMFCQRIAVISSATAAGYGDFCNQLADNDYGLQFQTRLFPATMQGEGVEQSVIAALDSINAEWEQFDCVVIIRGGGATSDLSGFDTLALAENVANFPLPIITGIGHERGESDTLGLAGCGAGAKVGLSVMGQKYSAIELCRTAQGCTVQLVQGMVKDLAPTGDAEETILAEKMVDTDEITVTMKITAAKQVQYALLAADGTAVPLGGAQPVAKATWTGARLALYARGGTKGNAACIKQLNITF